MVLAPLMGQATLWWCRRQFAGDLRIRKDSHLDHGLLRPFDPTLFFDFLLLRLSLNLCLNQVWQRLTLPLAAIFHHLTSNKFLLKSFKLQFSPFGPLHKIQKSEEEIGFFYYSVIFSSFHQLSSPQYLPPSFLALYSLSHSLLFLCPFSFDFLLSLALLRATFQKVAFMQNFSTILVSKNSSFQLLSLCLTKLFLVYILSFAMVKKTYVVTFFTTSFCFGLTRKWFRPNFMADSFSKTEIGESEFDPQDQIQNDINAIFASQSDLSADDIEPDVRHQRFPDLCLIFPLLKSKIRRDLVEKFLMIRSFELERILLGFDIENKVIKFFLVSTFHLKFALKLFVTIGPLLGGLLGSSKVIVNDLSDYRFFRISIWGFPTIAGHSFIQAVLGKYKSLFPASSLVKVRLKKKKFLGPFGGAATLFFTSAPAAAFNPKFSGPLFCQGHSIQWGFPKPLFCMRMTCRFCSKDHPSHLCFLPHHFPDRYSFSDIEKETTYNPKVVYSSKILQDEDEIPSILFENFEEYDDFSQVNVDLPDDLVAFKNSVISFFSKRPADDSSGGSSASASENSQAIFDSDKSFLDVFVNIRKTKDLKASLPQVGEKRKTTNPPGSQP